MYVLLYTALAPLSGRPCLNYPIILNYYISCVGCTKACHHMFTCMWATSHISYTFAYVSSQFIPGYIYLLVIHTYHLHSITRVFVLYVSHIIHAPLSTNGKGKQPSRYHVLPSYIHSIFYNHHSSTPTFYEFYPC